MRTMEAFALGTLYLATGTAGVECKQVKDASMGTWEWIEWQRVASIDEVKSPIFALETSTEALPLTEFIFPQAFTLVLGNEEYGCSQASLQKADAIIEIPLRGKKNSLNVANAFCCVAAEIARQHTKTING